MIGKTRIGAIWSWIERIAARLLIPLMFLQFLSGFAVLHPRIFGGVLLKSTAAQMHSIIQPPTALVFARLVFRRADIGSFSRFGTGRSEATAVPGANRGMGGGR